MTVFILSVSVIAIATAASGVTDPDTAEVGPPGPVPVGDGGITRIIQSEKPYDIVIYGSDPSAAELVNILGTAAGSTVATGSISDDKKHLAIMTEGWIESDPGSGMQFNGLLDAGDMAALFDTGMDWSSIGYPVSYPVGIPTVFAMIVEEGMSRCFSRTGESHEEALGALISWADSKLIDSGAEGMSLTSAAIGSGAVTNAEHQDSGRGHTVSRSA